MDKRIAQMGWRGMIGAAVQSIYERVISLVVAYMFRTIFWQQLSHYNTYFTISLPQ